MENKAHYALIGTFVFVAFIAMIGFFAWLSNSQWDQKYDNYQVVFNGPVRGLSEGSEVRLNGLKVGDVTDMKFDRGNANRVLVDIQVMAGTKLYRSSRAQLEPQGLTGLSYLQIFPGDETAGLLPQNEYAQIPGQMSQLDTFLDGGETIIDGANRALRQVNQVLDDDALEDFHAILRNLNLITENFRDTDIDGQLIEDTLMSIQQAAEDGSKAALAIESAAVNIDGLVENDVKALVAKAEQTLEEVDIMLADISEFADGGTDLTVDARDAINRLSNSGLTDLEETADGLRRLVLSLADIAEKLEQSPVTFIAGEEVEQMELPQ